MSRALQIIVRGKVQKVYYRKYAKKKADELGIKGKIKNEVDGSVKIMAEGDELAMSKFIEWCHEGSPFSFVDAVETEEVQKQGYRHFSIA